MPGLVPGIHGLRRIGKEVVDGRVKPAMTNGKTYVPSNNNSRVSRARLRRSTRRIAIEARSGLIADVTVRLKTRA